MDDRLRIILARTAGVDLDTVAAGALGAKAAVVGEPVLVPVAGYIVDPRTLGVVKVSGMSNVGGGHPMPWSAVAKVIDLAS